MMSEGASVFLNGVLVCVQELGESARQILEFYGEANKVLFAPRIVYGRGVERAVAANRAEYVSARQQVVAGRIWVAHRVAVRSALTEMGAADRELAAHVRQETRLPEREVLERLQSAQTELTVAASRLPQEPATLTTAAETARLAALAASQSRGTATVGGAVTSRGLSSAVRSQCSAAIREAKGITRSLVGLHRASERETQALERVATEIAETRARAQVLASDGWRSLLLSGSLGELHAAERQLATAARQVAKGDLDQGVAVLRETTASVAAVEKQVVSAAHGLWANNLVALVAPVLEKHGFAIKRRGNLLVATRGTGPQRQALTIRFEADGGVHYEPVGFKEHACQPVIREMRDALQANSQQFSEEPIADAAVVGWSLGWSKQARSRRRA